MLFGNRLCCTAKSFPIPEIAFQHCIGTSRPGNGFPVLQNLFPIGKSFSCTASSLPGRETVFLYCKIFSRSGSHFPVLHRHFPDSKRVCIADKRSPQL